MKKLILSASLLLMAVGCQTNPFTGKQTFNFLGNDYLFPTSFAQYDQFLKEHKVITGTPEAAMITKVGKRIATAAERWLYGHVCCYRWMI